MDRTHVILGAGGVVASELAARLLREGRDVRLLSRRGAAMKGAHSMRADLLDAGAVRDAIPEGAVVHLLAGLRYDIRVWREEWPRVMRNAIDACASRGARLIFFDNVYMYGPVDGAVMTEETPSRPSSRKGEVRKEIAEMLLAAARSGKLEACIARCADYYGPNAVNSLVHAIVLPPLSKGKPAQWLIDADQPHSLTYTPDCGRALTLLAAADDVWGEVWHLPTAAPPITAREFAAIAARAFGVEPRTKALPRWMLRIAAITDRTVRESMEMLYQYDRPYSFDSSKFERRFGFVPTPYSSGIEETVRAFAR